MQLYIMRHGETKWNRLGKLQGRTNIELSPEGIRLARESAQGMADVDFSHIFSSPLNRAYDTAQIIRGDRAVEIVVDERLIEVCFGSFEGCSVYDECVEMDKFFDHPESYVAKGDAESYEQIIARASSFLGDVIFPLAEREPDAKVLVLGHGALNRGLMYVLLNRELKDYWRGKEQRNCAVNIFDITDRKVSFLQEAVYFYEIKE